ncbi:MAG: STAS domain-containing protein [Nocardiaceae bacterium]|nr:STAS domain-containing protein [Nocardiaceae bacterium]
MSASDGVLRIERRWLLGGAVVLEPAGTLDSMSYLSLRDSIIKESVGEPRSIVVDVDRLAVPAESAWAVFTSARWHIATWPAVPLSIAASDPEVRMMISHSGIGRYVPCFPTVEDALGDYRRTPFRLRATVQLSNGVAGGVVGRTLIREALAMWNMQEFTPVCCIVGTHLIEMTAPITVHSKLRIEAGHDEVTVAIDEGTLRDRVRSEAPSGVEPTSEVDVLTSLCKAWGTLPAPFGRQVLWAVCGRGNIV